MSIFGSQTPGPTKIDTVALNQSVLGYPVPVVMGRGRIQQSILWVDGFSSKKVNASGGKGFGGGKGGTQYVYSADVIVALCNGPIVGLGDAWSGQSWLANTNADPETYTISGGSPSYTPVNSSTMTADLGVSVPGSFSTTVTDLGSGTTRTVSGSTTVAFERVPYGTTLASGQYSVDSSNNYHFSTADAGKTVTLSYSFSLSTIKKQLIALIPSGGLVQVGGSIKFAGDVSVTYYTGPNNGNPLTRDSGSGTPSTTGHYTVSGSAPASYKFASGDVGSEVLVTYSLDNTASIPTGTPTSLSFTLEEGNQGQSAWALLLSKFPSAAIGYSGIANLLYSPMDLGYSAQIQQNAFEVISGDAWGGGVPDCNPIQCILQVLTNKAWGLGVGPIPFPLSAIDNGAGGTWGPGKQTGTMLQDSTASAWFAANNFFISPVIDRQDTAASLISRWLEAGQCAAFMSEGLLKLVPYGDTTTAGSGAVWLAPSAFAAALDDTCFLSTGKDQDPVKSSTPSGWMDAFNVSTVTWDNRANQYAQEPTPESDQASINRYGQRTEDAQTWDFITTLQAATFAANMRVKRNVYVRNAYEFKLSYRYAYLEPMDVVYLTTSSQWAAEQNNINLGMVELPVRITKIVDNPNGTLDITAEDYPFGAHQPVIYNKGIFSGNPPVNMYADPGDTTVAMLVATPELADYHKNQLWIGAAGANADWGGCNVLVSMDGVTYIQIGQIKSPARLGALNSITATGSDPDTTHSFVVNLVDNAAPLEAGTHADADANNTLCVVDSELISYSDCAVSGINQFTLSGYIRRGVLGSTIAGHSVGSPFLRLDDSIFKYTFDSSWAGQSLYMKFQSFNQFGNSLQDLSTVAAISISPFSFKPGVVMEFDNTKVFGVRPTFGAGGRLPAPPPGSRY